MREQLKCTENDYDHYCLEDLKMIWHAQQSCDLDYVHKTVPIVIVLFWCLPLLGMCFLQNHGPGNDSAGHIRKLVVTHSPGSCQLLVVAQ